MLAWIVGAYVMDDATAPYLVSLGCALLGYALGACLPSRTPRAPQPTSVRRVGSPGLGS
jgi:hypothetical protein